MTERRSLQRRRHAGLVQPVTALVHRSVQPAGEVRLIPPSGDAHVMGAEPGGERVHGVVNPPPSAVKAHQPDDLGDQPALAVDREVAVERTTVDSV